EGASDDEADPSRDTQRQKAGQRVLFQQCIAPCEQENIEIALLRQNFTCLPLVDPCPERLDHLLVPELEQGTIAPYALGHQLTDPLVPRNCGFVSEHVDVMDKQDVHIID